MLKLKAVGFAAFLTALAISLFNVAWMALIICVIVHFVRKYW